MMAEERWIGRVFVSIQRALYIGRARDTELHAHHAIQACFALDEPFALRADTRSDFVKYDAALITSNSPHQLDGGNGRVALVYLEPENIDGRSIASTDVAAGIQRLEEGVLRQVRGAVRRSPSPQPAISNTCGLLHDICESLEPARVRSHRLDDRIGRIVADLRLNPNRYGSIPQLAKHVGLSPSRFRHLFTTEMGISCQRYLVWVRLYNAVRELGDGASLTEAAHRAGFADAAHLTRTFRRMFGIAPSLISRSVELIPAAR